MGRVLSIDPSLNSSGVCIFEDGLLYDFKVLNPQKDADQHIKMYQIANMLQQIITDDEIDEVVLEGMSFGSISTSSRPLAGVYYQILILCYINDLEWQEIAPTSIKKFATGSGRAKKPEMWKALPDNIKDKIERKYKTVTSGKYDVCDAYHIGMMYYHLKEGK